MASLFKAVKDFYDTLTVANFPGGIALPPFSESLAPVATSAGTQLRPPYVIGVLQPDKTDLTFEDDSFERYRLTITAFALTQADADTIMACIRFNGGSVSAAAGFENRSTLSGLTDGATLSITLERPPEPAQAGLDRNGAYVHRSTIVYSVEVHRS
jgi:hypothetical protein